MANIGLILNTFMRCNKRWSNWIEARLPTSFVTQLKAAHEDLAKDTLGHLGILLDVGAGFMSPFARKPHRAFVIGIDIVAEQIARNRDVDAGLVVHCPSALVGSMWSLPAP